MIAVAGLSAGGHLASLLGVTGDRTHFVEGGENLEVTGIAITPERKLVMVWDKNDEVTHVLGENERIQRWRVVSIDSQRVILRHPRGGRYEFIVNEDTLIDIKD